MKKFIAGMAVMGLMVIGGMTAGTLVSNGGVRGYVEHQIVNEVNKKCYDVDYEDGTLIYKFTDSKGDETTVMSPMSNRSTDLLVQDLINLKKL